MRKTKLRQFARGKPCLVRIPIVCNNNTETTVLAHKNGGGYGIKNHDLIGAWACSACHAWLDGGYVRDATNNTGMDRDYFHDDAIIRTQQELLKTENKHGVTLAQAISEWARGLET